MTPRFAKALSFLGTLTLALLGGCTTWEPVAVSPERLILDEQPPAVRITTVDGVAAEFDHPRIVGDSIVSSGAGPAIESDEVRQMCLPCADIHTVEVQRFSTRRTVALGAAIAALAWGWSSSVGDSDGGGERFPDPEPKAQLGPWSWLQFRIAPGG